MFVVGGVKAPLKFGALVETDDGSDPVDASSIEYELWEMYKPNEKLPMRTQRVGSWTPNTGLWQQGAREPYSRRTDLTGLHLNVVTVPVSGLEWVIYRVVGWNGTGRRGIGSYRVEE